MSSKCLLLPQSVGSKNGGIINRRASRGRRGRRKAVGHEGIWSRDESPVGRCHRRPPTAQADGGGQGWGASVAVPEARCMPASPRHTIAFFSQRAVKMKGPGFAVRVTWRCAANTQLATLDCTLACARARCLQVAVAGIKVVSTSAPTSTRRRIISIDKSSKPATLSPQATQSPLSKQSGSLAKTPVCRLVTGRIRLVRKQG